MFAFAFFRHFTIWIRFSKIRRSQSDRAKNKPNKLKTNRVYTSTRLIIVLSLHNIICQKVANNNEECEVGALCVCVFDLKKRMCHHLWHLSVSHVTKSKWLLMFPMKSNSFDFIVNRWIETKEEHWNTFAHTLQQRNGEKRKKKKKNLQSNSGSNF